MKESSKPDWEPLSDAVLLDPIAAHDAMRDGCPVAYSDLLGWSLFRHDDVTRVLGDHETSSLMEVRVNGARLTDEALTSVLRNWTVGEVGSLAAAVGIVAHDLAVRADLQQRLRADPGLLPAAIDELLRVTGPLVSNRRVATRDVKIGGRQIAAGERISLMWLAANRDPALFAAPEEVRLDRDPGYSLLYGAGIHVCPGAPLARLELRVAFEEVLGCSRHIELADDGPRRARYPVNGWASLPLRLS